MDKAEIIKTVSSIKKHFTGNSLTLSVAESCTGGLLCHYLTMIPGASKFFVGGIVVYSEESKKIFGISDKIIRTYGMISSEVAKEMAEKARGFFRTDYSISTTGNIGPDTLENKEKGLIYVAISDKYKTLVETLRLKGERIENKEEASFLALKIFLQNMISEHSI